MSGLTPRSPHRIVFANEKGGTGKSTTAVHVAVALAYQGAKVAAIDLDARQRTLHRYLENRAETERRRAIRLPGASFAVFRGETVEALDALSDELGESHDFLVFETKARRSGRAPRRHRADTLVTPSTTCFVDFDLIGRSTRELRSQAAFYADSLGSAQDAGMRRSTKPPPVDWVVVRNARPCRVRNSCGSTGAARVRSAGLPHAKGCPRR